jgi:5-methylcytosine-specific restriction endonuclease McrA
MSRAGAIIARITTDQWSRLKESYSNLCIYCLRRPTVLTMDHVHPLVRGGHHVIENIVPACKSCNSAKNKRSLLFFLADRQVAQKANLA